MRSLTSACPFGALLTTPYVPEGGSLTRMRRGVFGTRYRLLRWSNAPQTVTNGRERNFE